MKEIEENVQKEQSPIKEEQSPLFPDGAFEVKGENLSFKFTRKLSWLLVGIISFGLILFNLLGFTIFKGTAQITDYDWSQSDEFDVKEYSYLTADDNGDFCILQLSDLHILNGVNVPDTKTFNLAQRLIEKTNPDLIVLTGDIVFTWNNKRTLKKVIEFFDGVCKTRNIYWSMVFGNHDEMGYFDEKVLSELLDASKYCLFEIGPTNLNDGKYGNCLGNYAINIKRADGQIGCSLVMLDSNGRGVNATEGTYAPISYSTIDWYEWFVNGMTAHNNGNVLPSLAFFHIPLIQSKELMKNTSFGENGYFEKISSSELDTGLFEKIKMLKSTVATFSGHDHQNYFQGFYSDTDILLTNCVSCGYCAYGDTNLKGGRVIKLNLNHQDLALDTYVLFEKDL